MNTNVLNAKLNAAANRVRTIVAYFEEDMKRLPRNYQKNNYTDPYTQDELLVEIQVDRDRIEQLLQDSKDNQLNSGNSNVMKTIKLENLQDAVNDVEEIASKQLYNDLEKIQGYKNYVEQRKKLGIARGGKSRNHNARRSRKTRKSCRSRNTRRKNRKA